MKKLSLSLKVVVFSLLASILLPDNAPAQVSTLGNWTSIYHGSSSSGDVHYTIQPGSYTNRVLVVAIASGMTVRNNMSVSITYGGQALTLANGDMDSKVYQHTALYYLNEAGLEAASSDYLAFTVSGGTIVNTDVWAALFNYVNQGTPLTDSQTTNSGSSSYPSLSFSSPISPLTINAFNQAVEVVSSFRDSPDAASTIGYATNWTSVLEETAFVNEQLTDYSIRNGVANRSIPSSDITDPSSTTFTPRALASMTALSLSYQAPPAPSVQASNITFTNVTSSSFTINWTSGNGSNRIVLIKAGSAVDSDPVDNTTYIASNLFGSGSQLGTDNFVVYNGTGSSVAVDNLDANTTYYVAIYEFTVITGVATYLTPGATGSQLTGPETAQSGDYRSNGSGNWSTPDIWQTFNGTSWITATSAPTSSDGVITIRDGHTITVADAVTVDQVEVKSGGKVTVNSGVTWTIADGADAVDCNIDGTLYNQGTIATTGALAFSSGSTYQHAENGGTIPTATWDANSTCLVTGITDTAPSGFGQSFGNFTWDCESQTQTVVMNSDVTVKGSFRLISTKAGELALTNSTSGTLSVLGDYYQTGGTFNLNSGSASTATANLQVAGNFYFTGGTITESSSGSNVIIFDGSGNEQTYTSGGTFSNTINFTVNSGAYLQMGTGVSPSYISGSSGTFTLSAGATLGITDHYGITTSATSSLGGNIRVYPRNFDSGANYIYNGIGIGSASQNTGDGLPGTVNSLTFNNSGGSVSFTSTCFITNNFVITAGTVADLGAFSHTAGTLTLGVTSQPSGSYGSSASDATFKNDTYFALTTGIVTVKNGCTGGTWIGVTSSDWNTSSNWCGGIPTSSTDVIITSSVSNYPVVSATPTAVCHSLTINSGASLTIGPSGSSTVATGLTNNGTLNLQSDATGTASLILGSYVRGSGGTENVQLYLTGGNWHYISSPVSSLSTDVFTTGPTGTLDLAAYYEDRISSNQDNGWIAYDGWRYSTSTQGTDSTFSTLSPGQGYDYYNSGDQTFIFGGDFNTGDVSSTLLYNSKGSNPPYPNNQGFNLLGNPFSSCLDWGQIAGGLDPSISRAIYFTHNGSFASWINGVGTNGGTGTIPPMQGFFVKAYTAGKSVTLAASARVHNSSQIRYKKDTEVIPLVRLKFEKDQSSDEAVVRFDENATDKVDNMFDAYKFSKTGGSLDIWTTTLNTDFSINGLPFPEDKVEIPVGIYNSAEGIYKISGTQIDGLDEYSVTLTDNSTNISVDLKRGDFLSFQTPGGTVTGRFILKVARLISGVSETTASVKPFNIYYYNGNLYIQSLDDAWDSKPVILSVYDLFGRKLLQQNKMEWSKGETKEISFNGSNGVYFVELGSGNLKYIGKISLNK